MYFVTTISVLYKKQNHKLYRCATTQRDLSSLTLVLDFNTLLMELLKKKPFKLTFSMTMDVTRVYNQLLRNNVHIERERDTEQTSDCNFFCKIQNDA